ncbi:MAG TPA: HNH endonuclease [Clostridiaceae bacterium]
MNKVDKSVLVRLYIDENKPMHTISKELDIAIGTVYNYLHKYGIKTREQKAAFSFKGHKHSEDSLSKMSMMQKGRITTEEAKLKLREVRLKKGIGHKKRRSDGYIAVYFPDHPRSNVDGYIMEHILVMSCVLGIHINRDEVVHHINGKRDDNRIENLKLMSFKDHAAYHMKKRHENKRSEDLSTRLF